WYFDSLYFRGITEVYYNETGRRERNFFISRKYGTDPFAFDNIFHDGSKSRVFESTDGISVGKIVARELPAPSYVNSGFYEPAHRIQQWHPTYGAYFPVSKGMGADAGAPTRWK